ncbi:hypothetical protein E2C01_038552 [Portunus trituberculatus]|uniref:Uncharacterized protein n=1 Tax=Portunus trituberculatus TaxID=210409 RepID=A0A5B7FCI4_PORTR|nr:hypothetical protein [Portunus trituberculatus]
MSKKLLLSAPAATEGETLMRGKQQRTFVSRLIKRFGLGASRPLQDKDERSKAFSYRRDVYIASPFRRCTCYTQFSLYFSASLYSSSSLTSRVTVIG